MSADADMENLSMDSTCIKVHERANGGGKTADKAVGRTKGGLNTKLHAVVDGLGNTVTFLLSAGNGHDPVMLLNYWIKLKSAAAMCRQTASMELRKSVITFRRMEPVM